MCTKPEAYEIQSVYENYSGDDIYIVGASKNFTDIDTLDLFRQMHNLTFPLSSSEELGSYYDQFNESFITIGNNNVLIKKLPFYTEQSVLEESIEQSIVSFEGLYIIDDIKNLLLSENTLELNLEDIFYTEEGIDVDYSFVSSSNPDAVDVIINNEEKTLSFTKNLSYGKSKIILAATLNSTGDEIYTQFTIHNTSSIIESFETADLSSFNWILSGTSPWEISDSQKFSGDYSLKTTGNEDSDISNLSLTINVPVDGDSISFAYLSNDMSESDYFEFTIDGVTNYAWYGYKPWEMLKYPISSGTHHLNWKYQKASFDSDPNYNGYIDAIVFPENTLKIDYELSIMNYELKQNYPNPFNPVTRINYTSASLSVNQSAEIVVHNSLGQQVWSSPIMHHALRVTGSILFDGSKFNSGIYYYSLVVDGKRLSTKSMVLIK